MAETEPKIARKEETGNPVSSQRFENDMTNLLPIEMWMAVFSHLRDPQDWLNTYHAFPSFQRIMNPVKVTALLPAVLPILCEHQNTLNKLSRDANVGGEPPYYFFLTPKELLQKTRLICKAWRQTVTEYTSNHPSLQKPLLRGLDNAGFRDHFATALPIIVNAEKPADIQEMVKFLENPDKKTTLIPCSSRHLILKELPFVLEGGENGREEDPIVRLLERVGPSLWHFAVWAAQNEFETTEQVYVWYKRLIRVLNLLPNLKSLYIQQPNWYGAVDEAALNVEDIPAPRFPDLTMLQFDSCMETVFRPILERNAHIKQLVANCCLSVSDAGYNCPSRQLLTTLELPQLEEFSLAIFLESDELSMLEHVRWPLTNLRLIWGEFSDRDLSEALQPFRNTLRHLHVQNLCPEVAGTVRIAGYFPQLRHLEISVESGQPTRVVFQDPVMNPNLINVQVILGDDNPGFI